MASAASEGTSGIMSLNASKAGMAGSTTGTGIMSLNANKAGMTGLDTQKINAIIESTSKGSKFYQAKQASQARIDQRIAGLLNQLADFSQEDISRARNYCDQMVAAMHRDLTRTIVHVDMDMFYAAVEMRDEPTLKDKPMAVGGMGMLSTSNYLARRFGVRAAMPGFIAKKLCPELVIIPVNMEKYAAVSEIVRDVFRQYDPNFSPMSLDEAYLDVTEYLETVKGEGDGTATAASVVHEMRGKIEAATGLTASAGIAPNLMLAKVCSDMNKPNGQYQINPDVDEIIKFVSTLPIRKVGGIGNVSEQLLKAIGVQVCSDLWEKRGEIKLLFSDSGFHSFLQTSRGLGCTRIEPKDERGQQKSISNETTFRDNSDRQNLLKICAELSKDLSKDMEKKNIVGHAVTVKIKSHDFKQKTRVSQLLEDTNDADVITCAAKKILVNLLDTSEEQPLKLRLMGVRMSELRDKNEPGPTKQKTLKNFLSSKSKQSVENVRQTEYECPVCGKAVQVEGIKGFNEHLDNCLDTIDDKKSCEVKESVSSDKAVEMDIDCITTDADIPNSKTIQRSSRDVQREEEEDMFSEHFNGDEVINTGSLDDIFSEHFKEDKAQTNINVNNNMDGSSSCLPCSQPEPWQANDETNHSQIKSRSTVAQTQQRPSSSTGGFFKQKMAQERASSPVPVVCSQVINEPEKVEDFSENVITDNNETVLSCPVCLSDQVFASELCLTRHVESCLSKQAINSILKQEKGLNIKPELETNVSLKRRLKGSRSCTEQSTKKSSSKPIDSYFKRP